MLVCQGEYTRILNSNRLMDEAYPVPYGRHWHHADNNGFELFASSIIIRVEVRATNLERRLFLNNSANFIY
jgi:hypothetical protein